MIQKTCDMCLACICDIGCHRSGRWHKTRQYMNGNEKEEGKNYCRPPNVHCNKEPTACKHQDFEYI